MNKNKRFIPVYVDDEIYNRFKILSDCKKWSISKIASFILSCEIQKYCSFQICDELFKMKFKNNFID